MKKLLQTSFFIASILMSINLKAQFFYIKNPESIVGSYNFSRTENNYGGNIDTMAITGKLVYYLDSNGCDAALNPSKLNGNIALIQRGSCSFGTKILNAQNAGAAAVIIVNNPGAAPANMGQDTSKTRFINIPAIMISYEDNIKIKSNLDSNGTIAYIGKRSGCFENDLEINESYIMRARSFSTPQELAKNFYFNPRFGSFVKNMGSTMQNAVTLKAEVYLGNKLIHTATNKLDTLNVDSIKYIQLSNLNSSSYPPGYYTVKYSVSSDKTDDYQSNNFVNCNFYISNNLYSKVRLDSLGNPLSTNYWINGGDRKSCIALDEPNLKKIKIDGLTFSTSAATDSLHTGASITASIYEAGFLTEPENFNSITLVGSSSYTYKSNESNIFIRNNFNTPIELKDGKRYLACLETSNSNLLINYDQAINYHATTLGGYNTYYTPYVPVFIGGTANKWYASGYGPGYVPAIVLNTSLNTSSIENTQDTSIYSSVWKKKSDLTGSKRRAGVGFSIGNKGYIGTGDVDNACLNDFWEYDPATDAWTQKANVPGVARGNAIGMNIANMGYIGFGEDSADNLLKDVWQFNPDSNAWKAIAEFPGQARAAAVAFNIENKGYVGTGHIDLDDFWEYDPANDKWTQKANFGGGKRRLASGFSIAGKGYLGFGFDGTNNKNDFWEYDPVSDKWNKKANIPTAGFVQSVGMALGNYGYILNPTGSLSPLWEYSPITNSWTNRQEFIGYRYGAIGFSIGRKAYITTGDNGDILSGNNLEKDLWEYEIKPQTIPYYDPRLAQKNGLCAGEKYDLSFYSKYTFDSIYEYVAQLSDTNGKFDNPTIIGTGMVKVSPASDFPGADTGFIKIEIPNDIIGNRQYQYRILRMEGSKIAEIMYQTSTTNLYIKKPIKQAIVSENNKYSINCMGDEIKLSVKDGYNFLWNDSTTLQIKTINKGGIYKVTYSSNLCPDSLSIEITEKPELKASVVTKNINCFGLKNGAVNTEVIGGTAPYQYDWSNGSKLSNINNLDTGNYTLVVTDSLGCKDSASFEIKQPKALMTELSIVDVLCFGNASGEASAKISGGTMPYEITWSDSSKNSSIGKLKAGKYSVNVIDSLGCTSTSNFDIKQPDAIKTKITSQGVSCFGNKDGFAVAKVTGGSGPYNYNWSTGSSKDSIDMLAAGTYYLYVTDSLSCTDSVSFEIKSPSKLKTNLVVNNINCFGLKNGAASAQITGGTVPYQYDWSNGSKLNSINNLDTGNYNMVVTDSLGCKDSASVEIKQPKALLTVLNANTILCHGDATGEVSAKISGGNAPYQVIWSEGSKNNSINNLKAGKYSISVTDSVGCKDSAVIEIKQPELLKATITSDNVRCFGNKEGKAIAKVTGGIEPYTFDWSNGSKKDSIKNIIAGTYHLLVRDSVGCKDSAKVIISQPSEIILSTTKTDAACGNTSGFAVVNASGGVGGYTYLWSNSSNTLAVNNLASGGYTVTVTDTNNCKKIAIVNIGNSDGPNLDSIYQQPASCATTCDAIATVVIKGGKLPYTYIWNKNSEKNSATADKLCSGLNSIQIKDANNCMIGAYVEVSSVMPDPIFAGKVNIGGETLKSGNVQLYKYSKSQGAFRVLGYSDIDSEGNYSITGMQSGSYILAVNPDTIKYPRAIKTYYSSKLKWAEADTLVAYCDSMEQINLTVFELPEQKGLGKISGKIVDNTKGKRASEPIPGVDVSLEEEPDSKIVATTKTDENGDYLFTGVELGKYKIYVDIPGLGMTNTYKVEVQTEDSVVTDQDFFVDSTGTINVEVKSGIIKKTKIASFELYPNPSKDKIYILSDYTRQIQVRVINLLGKEVFVSNNLKSGDVVDLTNLEAGVYYFKIHTDGEEIIKKVIKQ